MSGDSVCNSGNKPFELFKALLVSDRDSINGKSWRDYLRYIAADSFDAAEEFDAEALRRLDAESEDEDTAEEAPESEANHLDFVVITIPCALAERLRNICADNGISDLGEAIEFCVGEVEALQAIANDEDTGRIALGFPPETFRVVDFDEQASEECSTLAEAWASLLEARAE